MFPAIQVTLILLLSVILLFHLGKSIDGIIFMKITAMQNIYMNSLVVKFFANLRNKGRLIRKPIYKYKYHKCVLILHM